MTISKHTIIIFTYLFVFNGEIHSNDLMTDEKNKIDNIRNLNFTGLFSDQKHSVVALASALQLYTCANGCSALHETVELSSKSGAKIMGTKDLVSEFFKEFSAGNIDAAFKMVSEDASWWVPGNLPFSGTKTKAEYLQIVGNIQNGFPDGLKLTVKSMIAEGDMVAVEVVSDGKHVNGRTYANEYHFLITVRGGQIVAVKEYMDTLHLYQLIQP